MNIDKQIVWIISGATLALGMGAAAYFLLIKKKPKSDKYGNLLLKNDKSGGITGGVLTATGNKGQAVAEPNWNNPFDMNYQVDVKQWVSPKQALTLEPTQALEMAQTLWKAKGTNFWDDDDETAVQTIFQKRLRDKVQVATLSGVFWNQYKTDLWEYLNGFLSPSEMEAYVSKPVRLLSNYTLK